MPLGSNYDYNAGLGAYQNAIQDYYQKKKRQNFLSTLMGIAGMGASLIPGLSPLAMIGIGEGTNLLQSGVTGTPYSPDFKSILNAVMMPKLQQQKRLGDVVESGQGAILPQDINKFGESYPDWIDWNALGGDSIGGAGPMSLSSEAVKGLGNTPIQAISPAIQEENDISSMIKKLQLQKLLNPPVDQPNNAIELFLSDPDKFKQYHDITNPVKPEKPDAFEKLLGRTEGYLTREQENVYGPPMPPGMIKQRAGDMLLKKTLGLDMLAPGLERKTTEPFGYKTFRLNYLENIDPEADEEDIKIAYNNRPKGGASSLSSDELDVIRKYSPGGATTATPSDTMKALGLAPKTQVMAPATGSPTLAQIIVQIEADASLSPEQRVMLIARAKAQFGGM